jgi:hypothetical protein
MIEPWIWWTIGISFAAIVLLGVAWISYGIWLANHRTVMKAQKRWLVYAKTERKVRQYKGRIARARGKETVRLEVPKVSHIQRERHEQRRW